MMMLSLHAIVLVQQWCDMQTSTRRVSEVLENQARPPRSRSMIMFALHRESRVLGIVTRADLESHLQHE